MSITVSPPLALKADPYARCACGYCVRLPERKRLPAAFSDQQDHFTVALHNASTEPSKSLKRAYLDVCNRMVAYWDALEIKAQEAGR